MKYDYTKVNWGMIIRLLVRQGITYKVIADMAGVTVEAVKKWVQNINNPRRVSADALVELARKFVPTDRLADCGL